MGTKIIRRLKACRQGSSRRGGNLLIRRLVHGGVIREMRGTFIHRLGAAYTSYKTYLGIS